MLSWVVVTTMAEMILQMIFKLWPDLWQGCNLCLQTLKLGFEITFQIVLYYWTCESLQR